MSIPSIGKFYMKSLALPIILNSLSKIELFFVRASQKIATDNIMNSVTALRNQ